MNKSLMSLKNTSLYLMWVMVSASLGFWGAASETADGGEAGFAIVEGGIPMAEIVISESAPRSVQLAADELQETIEKMSGATLPIVNEPGEGEAARIFVGSGSFADKLVNSEDLPIDGGFRMLSGSNWLALVGRDKVFEPKEPYARTSAESQDPAYLGRWDELTGSTWGNPVGNPMWRKFSRKLGIWEQDERGTLNAVYAFLRSLGVEWYMPGELGEVIPKQETILVHPVDETVQPDFGLRYHHGFAFGHDNVDGIMWYLRLGLNSHSEATGEALVSLSHGMRYVHERPEMKEAKPEFYALRGGQRATELNQPNLSSEELFEEHVRFVRFLFDHYDLPMVSIFPEDGAVYSEDEASAAKATPERGWLGSHSDYVWEYVNRVAEEVYKTHPDRLVSSFAYANYVLPPEKIDKLSPNLIVGLLPYRFHANESPQTKFNAEIRAAWKEKLGSKYPFVFWTHYPFNAPGRGFYGIPAYFPRSIAKTLRELEGDSLGELVEVMFDPANMGNLYAPGFNHLNSWVTGRFYWDVDQDIDAILEDYYTKFYGPAKDGMKALIEYCEQNWEDLKKDREKIDEVFRLLGEARSQAPEGSPFAARIELLADYLVPLRDLGERLAIGRENVPEVRIDERATAEIEIDGVLNDAAWYVNQLGVGSLVDVETGEKPSERTTVRFFWGKDSLYLGIRCEDSDMENLKISGSGDGDRAIWDGDHVEVMVETNSHSWYQMTVNPNGDIVDLDRAGGINPSWSSDAEVATSRDARGWTVEMRIPIAPPSHVDPLQMVVGEKPTPLYPWYINVCRNRPRDGETELTALAPTGENHFQNIAKFAEIYTGIKPEVIEALRSKEREN